MPNLFRLVCHFGDSYKGPVMGKIFIIEIKIKSNLFEISQNQIKSNHDHFEISQNQIKSNHWLLKSNQIKSLVFTKLLQNHVKSFWLFWNHLKSYLNWKYAWNCMWKVYCSFSYLNSYEYLTHPFINLYSIYRNIF